MERRRDYLLEETQTLLEQAFCLGVLALLGTQQRQGDQRTVDHLQVVLLEERQGVLEPETGLFFMLVLNTEEKLAYVEDGLATALVGEEEF